MSVIAAKILQMATMCDTIIKMWIMRGSGLSAVCAFTIQNGVSNPRTSVYIGLHHRIHGRRKCLVRFCDLANIFHKYKRDKSEDAAMCVRILTDAILDDVSLSLIGML